jgi:4-hydroxy-tetrahydrodipicolinate reductase
LDLQSSDIKSIRAGGIIGVHEIIFGFPFQTVRLKHESISREAFGNGAKFAVEELVKRENGMYTMEQLLGPYFIESNKQYIPKSISEPTSSFLKKFINRAGVQIRSRRSRSS